MFYGNFFGTTLGAEYQKSEILIGGNFKFFKLLVSPQTKNKNWKIIYEQIFNSSNLQKTFTIAVKYYYRCLATRKS